MDGVHAYRKSFCHGALCRMVKHRTNCSHIAFGQFRSPDTPASRNSVVSDLIAFVFDGCGPPQMGRINAGSIPAGMRGMQPTCERFAMRQQTHNPVRSSAGAPVLYDPVAVFQCLERPYQALRGAVIHMRGQPSHGLSARVAAIWIRAYTGSSHFDLSSGWLGQGPSQRCNARRVRCLYSLASVGSTPC